MMKILTIILHFRATTAATAIVQILLLHSFAIDFIHCAVLFAVHHEVIVKSRYVIIMVHGF